MDRELAQRVRGVSVDKIVVNALDLEFCAHQVAVICRADLMHLENVVIAVGQFHFNGFAACGAGVHNLIWQQGVALRCCGFFDGDIGVKRKLFKYYFTIAVCGFLSCFLPIVLIGDLKSTARQWCAIFISF